MEKPIEENTAEGRQRSGSIKQKFIVLSIILFLVILIGGSTVFIISIRKIILDNKGNDLSHIVTIERINLEASVNGEIAIALKMADSPLIKRYFVDPDDPELAQLALEEIAGYRRAFAANTVFWVNDKDHKFYSDDAYAFDLDINDPNNYWYFMTLNETEKYNFNINYNPDLGVTNLWINAPVFDANRKPIGILGTGIDITAFINSIYKNYTWNAALYFFNDAGEITGARDASLVANKVSIAEVLNGAETEIFAMMKDNALDKLATIYTGNAEIAVSPVPALGWYAMVVESVTIWDYLNTSITTIFLVMMALIALLFVIFNISISAFLRPLGRMVETLNQISTNWDLTRRIDIRQNDEIGVLADYFNLTFERIRELLKAIRDESLSLSTTGETLAANMTETAAAINEINANIQSMKGQVMTQTDEVNASSGAMDRIMGGLEKLNDNIAVQVSSVDRSSSAIEEMLASIRAVTETLIKNTANITSLGQSSEAGREDLGKVSSDIQEIAKESEGLLQINSVMQNIASQTNLLAMNAAIEAAHAGESGRGFAVVADEIRKLAENSGQQSKTISTVLKKIKVSIDTISRSTGIVLERFEAIAGDVETVSNQESHIRNAMEEQEIGSKQILEAIGQLNSITGLVKGASSEMAVESREVMTQSSSLIRITEEVSGGMDEMAIGADQINTAVNKVNEISVTNKDSIAALSRGIAKFRLD